MDNQILDLLGAPIQDPTREELSIQINTLQREVERLQMNFDAARRRNEDLNNKINNVRGHIMDLFSMNGELDEDIQEIAALLDIELTKRVEGTATIEINFSFEAPLGFDVDSFELSVDVESNSYEVDNFEWSEDSVDISCEEA